MTFSTVARQVFEYRRTNKQSITVGLFMEARAFWLLNNGGVEAQRGIFVFGSHSDLLQEVSTPGFSVLLPQFVGNFPGIYDAGNAPTVLMSDFLLGDLGGVVPPTHLSFINQLTALYNKRIFGKNIVSKEEEFGIKQLMAAGFPVIMEQSETRSDEHNAAAPAFLEAERHYRNQNVELGAEALLRAREDLEFWSRIQSVVETIATGPTQIAKVAGKFLGLNAGSLTLGGLALAAVIWAIRGSRS